MTGEDAPTVLVYPLSKGTFGQSLLLMMIELAKEKVSYCYSPPEPSSIYDIQLRTPGLIIYAVGGFVTSKPIG